MAFNNSNIERFQNIINSKKQISLSDAGETIDLTIQSVKLSHYDEDNDLIKDIYSVNAVKAEFFMSDYYKTEVVKAVKLEQAKDYDGARRIFDDLLNKSGMSFSVINNGGNKTQFVVNEEVKCPIILVETKDKRQTTAIGKAYAKKSKEVSKAKIDLSALMATA